MYRFNVYTQRRKSRQRSLWKRLVKRRRKRRIKKNAQNKIDPQTIGSCLKKYYSGLLFLLKNKGYIDSSFIISQNLKIPEIFSLKENLEGTILFIKQLLSTCLLSNHKIVIDFSQCKKVCMSSFTLFDIIVQEIETNQIKFNENSYKQILRRVHFIKSKNSAIDKYLLAFNHTKEIDSPNEGDEYLPLGLISGTQRSSYKENLKAQTCGKIIEFVNKTLKRYDVEFSGYGINAMDRLISEILGNVEDHSVKKTWYVNGISYKDSKDNIIELNLSILNFGNSIFEGFEENKVLNTETYSDMEKLYERHRSQFTKNISFTKESLFTLYALQEGISRLKYEKPSRGNGTMNFIEAFIDLGEYGNKNSRFKPELNIISGHTILHCNNQYKPYKKDDVKLLSLNQEKDLSLLPNQENLYSCDENFPGTFLDVKIYLDKERLEKAIENNNNGNN